MSMKLSEIRSSLLTIDKVKFVLPSGATVPEHFHVTEVGLIEKKFIDCGGTVRQEKVVNFQLWSSDDTDHRLQPEKLADIIMLSERVLGIEDLEVEVEYQSDTIGKYGLEFNGKAFQLISKTTACLAPDQCGVPPRKQKIQLQELVANEQTSCKPGSGCCG
jgi:hypothetical protein